MPPELKKRKAFASLTEREKGIVDKHHKLAFKAANYYISKNEVYQRYEYCALDAAIVHLIVCARHYDESRGVTFRTYYYHSVNRRIHHTVLQAWKQDMKDLYHLYALRDDRFNESARPNRHGTSTVSQIADREYVNHLIQEAKLTPEQRIVLDEFMSIKGNNRTRAEWFKAERLGISKQAYHARLDRAIEKLRVTARKN